MAYWSHWKAQVANRLKKEQELQLVECYIIIN